MVRMKRNLSLQKDSVALASKKLPSDPGKHVGRRELKEGEKEEALPVWLGLPPLSPTLHFGSPFGRVGPTQDSKAVIKFNMIIFFYFSDIYEVFKH